MLEPACAGRRRTRHVQDLFQLGERRLVGITEDRHIVSDEQPVAVPRPDQGGEVADHQRHARVFHPQYGKTGQQDHEGKCHGQADQTATFDGRQM
ncbi:hypothetical protein D3C87_1271890 [compost metagenome]